MQLNQQEIDLIIKAFAGRERWLEKRGFIKTAEKYGKLREKLVDYYSQEGTFIDTEEIEENVLYIWNIPEIRENFARRDIPLELAEYAFFDELIDFEERITDCLLKITPSPIFTREDVLLLKEMLMEYGLITLEDIQEKFPASMIDDVQSSIRKLLTKEFIIQHKIENKTIYYLNEDFMEGIK